MEKVPEHRKLTPVEIVSTVVGAVLPPDPSPSPTIKRNTTFDLDAMEGGSWDSAASDRYQHPTAEQAVEQALARAAETASTVTHAIGREADRAIAAAEVAFHQRPLLPSSTSGAGEKAQPR